MRARLPVLAAFAFVSASAQADRRSDPETRWTLKTQDTEVQVGLDAGLPAILSLHAPTSSWNWIQAPNRETLPASVDLDGNTRELKWTFSGADYRLADRHLELIFVSVAPALELRSIWQAPRGRGPIEHWLTLKNATASRVTLGAQPSLQLPVVAAPLQQYVESTQVRRGGANALTQGGVLSQPVSRNWEVMLSSRPSDGSGSVYSLQADAVSQVPFLNLQVEAAHGMYVGWKFSAVGELLGKGYEDHLELSVGLAKDFRTDVFPGETFLIPAAFVGTYIGDQEEGSYTVHRYVTESLLPQRGPGPYPTLAYNYYLDGGEPGTQDEAAVLSSAALAHELGFETFVADAMWFPESGDWRWDPKRFPRGARPIADYLHRQGMKFGLWMAWTHGSRSTDPGAMTYARYPEFFAAPPKWPQSGNINWEAQIDVGNEAARAWVERDTERAVREFGLDYLKTDYSPIAIDSVAQKQRGQHQTDVSYWSTLGYYRVQESLLRKFPGITLEGCSAGGRIKDFGNIQHAHYVVGTDTLSALSNRQSVYDTSVMFPPSTIQLYTYERFFSQVADAPEPYLWRSAMMGAWQMDLTQSAKLTRQQKTQIKRATQIYKSWIRPVLADPKVHRILPRADGTHWDGLFYWNESIKRGTVYVFRPNSERTRQVIYLKGLDPNAPYHLRGEDGAIAEQTQLGRALMEEGILMSLPARFSSEIVYVEADPQR